MKSKHYFLFAFLFLTGFVHAQTNILISNGFDNYNGLPNTVAPGWYYSYNDTAAISKSFYNTAGFFGASSPAYKFGFDSVTVISPAFNAADSLTFWMKGNGSVKDSNTFEVYTSPDSISWNLLISMDSISPTAANMSLPVPSTAKHIKFLYHKPVSGYNVGLDDIFVLKNSGVGISETHSLNNIRIYPTPTSGEVTILFPGIQISEISVYDLLGNRLNQVFPVLTGANKISLDLSSQHPGFYFIRMKTTEGLITKRITVK